MKREKYKYKVTGSYDTLHIFRDLRRNKFNDIGLRVDPSLFYKIIRAVNEDIANEICNGYNIDLPLSMGNLLLRKFVHKVKIVDGKVKSTYHTDWIRTLQLWKEDEEAAKAKIFVKNIDEKDFIYLKYTTKKCRAKYTNMTFFTMLPHVHLRRRINQQYREGLIDAIFKY